MTPGNRAAVEKLIEEALSEDVRLAVKIRSVRERLDLTQPELAARFGVHPNTASKWEGAVRRPSGEVMGRIAGLLPRTTD